MLKSTPCGGFYADEENFTIVDGKTVLTPQAHYDIIIKVEKPTPTAQKIAILEKGDFQELKRRFIDCATVNGIYILHENQGTHDFYGSSQLVMNCLDTSDEYDVIQCADAFQNMFYINEDNTVTIIEQ